MEAIHWRYGEEKMVVRRKKSLITLAILILLVSYYFSQLNWISISKEFVSLEDLPEEFDGFKIVQLADLHNKEFGEGNKRLVDKINGLEPDIIVITGDMLNNSQEIPNNGEVLVELLENLSNDYPIYYVTGEHEEGMYYEDRNKYQNKGTKEEYEERLRELGITVLNDEKATITEQDSKINLYGLKEHLSGEMRIEHRLGKTSDDKVDILLSHRPFYFDEYVDWGADLVFSGDTHGGMIHLPFIGGVVSTEELFPEYDGGLYHKESSLMVVSRGLGNNPVPLRVNNRPELVEIVLKSK
ncbi:metallophosphoesterase [Guptibacillus hwajinpoensis]|uniref:metallophosphoesterase n=1 Tax=Guptibacillus hwajinpoensis TaxID=208199 RepID=UPI00069CF1EC|nr:metallophosphoesterase [Alkalihalobacillus macyae]MDP4550125.1 metallophosphoesterase [Alkalihalobacillus macyae]